MERRCVEEIGEIIGVGGGRLGDVPRGGQGAPDHIDQQEVSLRLNTTVGPVLHASLLRPPAPVGLVLMAHGSGSDRFSPRNRAVAARLQREHLVCLLPDLLTPQERSQQNRRGWSPVGLTPLTERLLAWIDWTARQPELAGLPIGLFGASSGAAAVLTAAALRPEAIAAVICRGGRVDLAEAALPLVQAPVLLIVGELDREVLALNRLAAARLRCPHQLSVIPQARHLFEEPGSLAAVGDQSAAWLGHHLLNTNDSSGNQQRLHISTQQAE